MTVSPEQSEQHPTAAKSVSSADEVPSNTLSYRGAAEPQPGIVYPWYVRSAGLIMFGVAGLLLFQSLLLAVWAIGEAISEGLSGFSVWAPLVLMAATGFMVLEYMAVKRNRSACAIAVGCIAMLAGVALCMFTADAFTHSWSQAIILATIAATAAFCAVAHLIWAIKLHRSRSGSGQV